MKSNYYNKCRFQYHNKNPEIYNISIKNNCYKLSDNTQIIDIISTHCESRNGINKKSKNKKGFCWSLFIQYSILYSLLKLYK